MRWLVGIPGAWLLIEWWRSWFLTGFGWLALGYAHTDNWLGGLAPVVGQYGLGLLTLVLAGALVTLLLGEQRARIVAGALFVAVWAVAFGLRGIEWTSPTAGRSPWRWCRARFRRTRNGSARISTPSSSCTRRARARRMARISSSGPSRRFPTWLTTTSTSIATCTRRRARTARRSMIGTLRAEENPKTGEEEYFNSVLSMDKSTPGVGWYDKHHLVPFTEFVPVPGFVRQWLRLMSLPYSDFNRGAAQQAPLEAAGQRISASVCYEDAYGSTQLPALRTATMLVNVTNDAWFGHSTGALPASADIAHARHGGRAPDGAGGQRRRVGGHRPPRRNYRHGAGI